jgi:hypothetical protein
MDFTYSVKGRAMAQADSRQPLTAESRVRAQVNPCGICGGQSGTGTGRNLIMGLLSNPQTSDMSMEPRQNDIYRGKPKNSGKNTCPSATWSRTNPMWTNQGKKLSANRMSHGTA